MSWSETIMYLSPIAAWLFRTGGKRISMWDVPRTHNPTRFTTFTAARRPPCEIRLDLQQLIRVEPKDFGDFREPH
jgi:hypothetical protein